MPSFDVVSEVDLQEVKNAVEQVKKEILTRYDFKDSKSEIELKEKELLIEMRTSDKVKLTAMQELIRQKLSKRGVSVKSVVFKDPEPAGGDTLRQLIEIKQGLKDEELKRVTKAIKAHPAKVSAQIQGAQVRVSGKKKDDLQAVMQHLRIEAKDLELQFNNFRE